MLERLAVEVGLDPGEVSELLAGDRFADGGARGRAAAPGLGIDGVPFFVIDDRYGISGAQPAELIGSALEQAWRELTI